MQAVLPSEKIEAPAPARSSRRELPIAPLAMIATVALGISAPLLRAPTFYYWDDTAGASVGAWRHIADALFAGRLPLLNLESWRGGNYAAEAAFGLYNPLLLALYAITRPIDDLAMAAFAIKSFFFLTMALGTYLLSRAYGVRPWQAAVAGAVIPLSGFTLWMDGAAWVTGLTVTALTPWVWFTGKRAALGRGSLLWMLLAGYLCSSAGNPYGLLSTALVIGALILETALRHSVRRIWGLVVGGVAVALLSCATYLPFVLSSSVSYRAGATTYNDEFLSPGVSDLLGLSSPSFLPYINAFGHPAFSFPALYLSWLVIPLLPWLRWSELRRRGRSLSAIYALGVVNLLLVLGPSQIGFFRWPARLLPYLWLSVVVLLAVLLNAGLHRSRLTLRWSLSAVGIFAGFWIAWSDVPPQWDRHLFSVPMTGLFFYLTMRAGRVSERGFALTAMISSLLVLVVQLSWMPVNSDVLDYHFPRSQALIQQRFAHYGPGLTVQIADLKRVDEGLEPNGIYRNVLFGSMYTVAGIESLTAYSGVGFNALDGAQCMAYQGATCPEAWDELWRKSPGSTMVLADLLRAETVVVQRNMVGTRADRAPAGWELGESNRFVNVWHRVNPLPWPEGRLSASSGGLRVTADLRTGAVGEATTFHRDADGPAALTFARLAWPGYTARIGSRQVAVHAGRAGLLTVEVPRDVQQGTLTLDWSPPGSSISMASAGVGLLLAALLAGTEFRRRRSPCRPHRSVEDELSGSPMLHDRDYPPVRRAHDPEAVRES